MSSNRSNAQIDLDALERDYRDFGKYLPDARIPALIQRLRKAEAQAFALAEKVLWYETAGRGK